MADTSDAILIDGVDELDLPGDSGPRGASLSSACPPEGMPHAKR